LLDYFWATEAIDLRPQYVTMQHMSTNSENSNINLSPQNTAKSKQDVADALLQTMEPLMAKLQIIIGDYILSMRRQLLAGETFVTVRQAARRVGVSVPTLYVWIDKGIINPVYIEDKIYVPITEVRYARDTIYQPIKATKKAGRKQITPVESKPLIESIESKPKLEVKVVNGLPHLVYPEGNSNEDSTKPCGDRQV
jgi:hypothetical protein